MPKKNPILSLYLQGLNRVAGTVRGQVAAEAARQRTTAIRQAARFWSGTWLSGTTKPTRKR